MPTKNKSLGFNSLSAMPASMVDPKSLDFLNQEILFLSPEDYYDPCEGRTLLTGPITPEEQAILDSVQENANRLFKEFDQQAALNPPPLVQAIDDIMAIEDEDERNERLNTLLSSNPVISKLASLIRSTPSQ